MGGFPGQPQVALKFDSTSKMQAFSQCLHFGGWVKFNRTELENSAFSVAFLCSSTLGFKCLSNFSNIAGITVTTNPLQVLYIGLAFTAWGYSPQDGREESPQGVGWLHVELDVDSSKDLCHCLWSGVTFSCHNTMIAFSRGTAFCQRLLRISAV